MTGFELIAQFITPLTILVVAWIFHGSIKEIAVAIKVKIENSKQVKVAGITVSSENVSKLYSILEERELLKSYIEIAFSGRENELSKYDELVALKREARVMSSHIKNLPKEQRLNVLNRAAILAIADGDISASERAVLDTLAETYDVKNEFNLNAQALEHSVITIHSKVSALGEN